TQLPQILPKAVSDFTTLVIERNVTESLEAVVLAKSSSQLKSTYEASASLSEYELTKILLGKMEESKSHLRADYKRKLYDALVESRDDKDKDQDPSARSDRETKRRKSSKEAESQKDPRGVDDSRVQKNQEFDTGNSDEQPEDKVAPKNDWFKKPERPLTPDPDWNKRHVRIMKKTRSPRVMSSIGLPKDIYKLINHNIEAKAIWDNVKMLLAGSELTKEDRESQLYDEFERFKMLPGENINEYYVRFHKLVNDMRNIRMTMPNIQLNSKFVNNMSPEWDRFVTAVKLNKGLKETNHEQLYAYLKQHEKHDAQDRLIIERITPPTNDPLAFVSSVQPYSQPSQSQSLQYQSSTTPSQSQNVQSMTYPQFAEPSSLDTGYTQTDEILDTLTKQYALLTQSFRATLPQTNNQLRTSSNTRN
ncbi:hypothetical protein Tco_0921904, partial [Tanacetum coccineum]